MKNTNEKVKYDSDNYQEIGFGVYLNKEANKYFDRLLEQDLEVLNLVKNAPCLCIKLINLLKTCKNKFITL